MLYWTANLVNSTYVDDIFAVKSVITKFIHSLPTAGYDIDATEAHAKTSVIVL